MIFSGRKAYKKYYLYIFIFIIYKPNKEYY